MSVEMVRRVYQFGAGLPPWDKAILLALAHDADELGMSVLTNRDLAAMTGLSQKRIEACLHDLTAGDPPRLYTAKCDRRQCWHQYHQRPHVRHTTLAYFPGEYQTWGARETRQQRDERRAELHLVPPPDPDEQKRPTKRKKRA